MSSAHRYRLSLVWFRRDLRVADNTALAQAVKESESILPVFIFDRTIIDELPKNDPRLGFLAGAVRLLHDALKSRGAELLVFEGDPKELIPKLIKQYRINALYHSRSHTAQDATIGRACAAQNAVVHAVDDTLLVPPEAMGPRKVFTPFYRAWQQIGKAPVTAEAKRIASVPITGQSSIRLVEKYVELSGLPWRADGWKQLLQKFDVCRYEATRNLPGIEGTSRMSPYLRFGLLSIRQLYHHILAKNSPSCVADTYLSELAWREFWYHIMHHFPETRTLEFQTKRRGLAWRYDAAQFAAWQEGRTGYPIVDAGMRQLRQEGWMHGRVRMIAASFLTKDLLMDWRLGEQHFANLLLDYDENVNIGNWQWAASVGADPKPLRIFSPILQSQRFDPEASYIKKYVPELKHESPARIHDPLKYRLAYHEPIVDHREMQRRARLMYAK